MVPEKRDAYDPRIGRYLVGLVEGGTYRPGVPLPSVRELAEQFGTPAHAVRMHLQRLVHAGMLEEDHANGTFVRCKRTKVPPGHKRIAVLYAHSDAGFFMSAYYGAIVGGIDRRAREAGMELLFRSIIDNTGGHPMRVFHELDSEVAGFVVIGLQRAILRKIKNTLRALAKPCVIVGYKDPEEKFETVYCDNGLHSRMAVRALLDAGHRRIGCVYFQSVVRYHAEEELNPTIARRLTAYRNAMRMAGIGDTAGLELCWKRDGKLAEYLERARPTALFCTADLIALGLYPQLAKLGYRIPDDITLMGFGGSPDAECSDPPLATVVEPLDELGRTAVERVLALRNGVGREPRDTLLPATLALRGSFGAPRDI